MLVALMLSATWWSLGAAAESASDLRGDIPSGDSIRHDLAQIADERATVLADLTSAEAQLAAVLQQREKLAEDQRRQVAEIDAALTNLQRLAVQAFITGGESGQLELLASVGGANDFAWRQHLVKAHAGSSSQAIDRLRLLRAKASDEVLATIEAANELRVQIMAIDDDLAAIEQRAVEANEVLPLAEAWDRAEIAIKEGAYGMAPADKWEKLRFCESTHNYEAISPSGLYRGAYQFDFATWRTVGGHGDPALAPPAEQDARARELYARRGDQPWPVCGRFLK